METISKMFYSNQKRNQFLIFISLYCLTLMLLRAKITHSIYLFFLIWNLLLAAIPYIITSFIATFQNKNTSKLKLAILLFIWLLFLPNAFYIVTDLIHLSRSTDSFIWFDLILICSFSVSGFILGLESMIEFEKITNQIISSKFMDFLILIICYLCGFGIFLGRMLRFNSWELASNPLQLIVNATEIFLEPETILFSANFGLFIYITFKTKKNFI